MALTCQEVPHSGFRIHNGIYGGVGGFYKGEACNVICGGYDKFANYLRNCWTLHEEDSWQFLLSMTYERNYASGVMFDDKNVSKFCFHGNKVSRSPHIVRKVIPDPIQVICG